MENLDFYLTMVQVLPVIGLAGTLELRWLQSRISAHAKESSLHGLDVVVAFVGQIMMRLLAVAVGCCFLGTALTVSALRQGGPTSDWLGRFLDASAWGGLCLLALPVMFFAFAPSWLTRYALMGEEPPQVPGSAQNSDGASG